MIQILVLPQIDKMYEDDVDNKKRKMALNKPFLFFKSKKLKKLKKKFAYFKKNYILAFAKLNMDA